MIKVKKGQDPYSVIGQYIRDHISAIEDMIAVIEIDGRISNQLFTVDMTVDGYFIWGGDWYEGEENVVLIDFFPVSDACNPENHWIPCSERMPDEHEWLGTKEFGTTISDEVYVTFETPKGERFCKHLNFQNRSLSNYDQHTIDVFYKGSKPIAWMPLPEPWKGETK